ncbi:ABC transporter substrate-binding protein [Streptomyces kaniharaensis]|uniref:ABC transporter substrate-binding protein n=1 Tax=Streptomyces kaniharaensis TaxID=212423 RepID=A0A6N7KY86_9ACTN|nr:ABC transporter substrate-binding protein [Streptomyces kaniharaensis]MQS16592.1 ABC transporter substrate-binding protein [Streptomyces kaniharaensis]
MPRPRTGKAVLAAAGLSGLLASGCAATPAPPNASSTLRSRLPQAIRDSGELRIGSYLNYVPVDFKDPGGAPAGLDLDIATALGSYLGLRVRFVDMAFNDLIPAVQAGKLDLAMSAVIDSRDRQQGKDAAGRITNPGVDFVDYFMTGTSILVKAGNPLSVSTLDSLCGHTIAVQGNSVQIKVAKKQSAACARTGKPLRVDSVDNDDQALAEIASGTAVADLNDYPGASYNTTAPDRKGRFQLVGNYRESDLYGIAVSRNQKELPDILFRALNQLIGNGTYQKILDKWNLGGGAVISATLNAGL